MERAAAGALGAAAALAAGALACERARCRRALAERDEARARADREITLFAGLASHDLLSPLRKAAIFAEQLRERAKDKLDDSSRDLLNRLLASVGSMQALVDGLAALSRASAEAEPRRVLDLGLVAREALQELGPLEPGARVDIEALPRARAEPGQMRRLLAALLSNALKFRRPGRPPEVRVSGRADGDGFVELLVEDHGVGFNMAQAARLFQPFSRLHGVREFPGAGLGLAVCRRIVERHGGSISAESRPGEGTTVRVRLPAPRGAGG